MFVLTHHRHDPIQMDGGTTFHFVTEGFDAAYAAAREAAGDNGVDIAGGASTVRQALAAGVIDELTLDIAPVLLGSGERIFDGSRVLRLRAGRSAALTADDPYPLPPRTTGLTEATHVNPFLEQATQAGEQGTLYRLGDRGVDLPVRGRRGCSGWPAACAGRGR